MPNAEGKAETVLFLFRHQQPPDPPADSGINSQTSNNSTQGSLHNRTTQGLPTQYQVTQSIPTNPPPPNDMDDFEDDDNIFMEIDEEALLESVSNNNSARAPAPAPPASSTRRKIQPPNPPQLRLPTAKPKKFVSPVTPNTPIPISTQPNTIQTKILGYLKPVPNKLAPSSASGPKKFQPPLLVIHDDDIDIVEDEDESKVKTSKAPYQYIKQVNSGVFNTGDIVNIKGTIATLTSNIEVDKTNGDWKLSVNINDGSGYLVASISPQVNINKNIFQILNS